VFIHFSSIIHQITLAFNHKILFMSSNQQERREVKKGSMIFAPKALALKPFF